MGINKKITWWEPEFGEEEAKAVYDVVKSGYVNEGKHSEELSKKIKKLLNVIRDEEIFSGISYID